MRALNRHFDLERPRGEADAGGHLDLSDNNNWESLGDFWLKLHGQGSREFYRERQVQADITHVADVPWSSVTADITTDMRWNDGERILNITGAYDVDDAHRVVRMRCVQRV